MIPLSDSIPAGSSIVDLLPAEARLHRCGIDPIAAAAEQFPGIQLEESLRVAVSTRQLQYLAGRFCALNALRAHGCEISELPRAGNGLPLWPGGFVGSISHTDDEACAAVMRTSDATGIGVDVEPIVNAGRASRLAAHIALRSELAHAYDAGFDAAEAFTLLFSAKESLFKCLFPLVERRVGYDAAEIRAEHDGTFAARLTERWSRTFDAGTTFSGRWANLNGRIYTTVCFRNQP